MKNTLLALVLFSVVILTAAATSGIELYNQGRLYEAEETLEEAIQTGRASIIEMAVLGMTYTRLGKYKQARELLSSALQLAPEEPYVLNALAMLEFATGNYETAYRWLDQAQSGPESSGQSMQSLMGSLINRAVRLYQQGKLEESAAALHEAHTLDPRNARVIAMLIQLYRQQGDNSRLIELYQSFIKLQPDNAQAHAELGILLEKAGRPKAAETAFLQAEHYNTEEPYPYFYLARTAIGHQAGTQAPTQAAPAEQRSRLHLAIGKAVRKISEIRVQAAGTFQQKQGNLSAEELEALQELTSRTEKPKQIMKESLDLLQNSYQQPEEYEQDLHRLTEWYPHSLELRCALGRQIENMKRPAAAADHWREIIEDFPTATEAHIGLARCLQALGREDDARTAYHRARDLDPENPQIYQALQQLYTSAGLRKELLQFYADIYERERTNIVLIYARAELEEHMGLTEQATIHRLRAAELEQRNENTQH